MDAELEALLVKKVDRSIDRMVLLARSAWRRVVYSDHRPIGAHRVARQLGEGRGMHAKVC